MSSFICVLASSLTTVTTSALSHHRLLLCCQIRWPLVLEGVLMDFREIPEPYPERSTAHLTPSFLPKSVLTCFLYLHGSHPAKPSILEFPASGEAALSSRSPRLESQRHLNTFPYPPLAFPVHLGIHWFFPYITGSPRTVLHFRKLLKVFKSHVKSSTSHHVVFVTVTSTVILVWVRISDYFILKRMLFDYKWLSWCFSFILHLVYYNCWNYESRLVRLFASFISAEVGKHLSLVELVFNLSFPGPLVLSNCLARY